MWAWVYMRFNETGFVRLEGYQISGLNLYNILPDKHGMSIINLS